MSAPRDVQESVASGIPLSRFGPRTRRMLGQEFGQLDTRKPVGQLGPQAKASDLPLPVRIAARLKAVYPHLTTGQCVELVQHMNNLGNVHQWLRGDPAATAAVGDAVATFGRHGDSRRYAYGGSGTMGINRDHAGDVVKVYPDGSLDLLNQSRGRSPHVTHVPNTGKGGEGDSSSYFKIQRQSSWLGLDKRAAQMMASNWGGDSVHHHYDNSDNSMTYHDNRKTNVTVTGANEPHEVAAAVGSTLDKAFSPSQAKQRFLQGAIS
jgi:hypothetical protein